MQIVFKRLRGSIAKAHVMRSRGRSGPDCDYRPNLLAAGAGKDRDKVDFIISDLVEHALAKRRVGAGEFFGPNRGVRAILLEGVLRAGSIDKFCRRVRRHGIERHLAEILKLILDRDIAH